MTTRVHPYGNCKKYSWGLYKSYKIHRIIMIKLDCTACNRSCEIFRRTLPTANRKTPSVPDLHHGIAFFNHFSHVVKVADAGAPEGAVRSRALSGLLAQASTFIRYVATHRPPCTRARARYAQRPQPPSLCASSPLWRQPASTTSVAPSRQTPAVCKHHTRRRTPAGRPGCGQACTSPRSTTRSTCAVSGRACSRTASAPAR